jgi:quercetin dioxygenase-like cupin family protein
LTIADKAWRPANGERVAAIGPLQVKSGVAYSAQFLEATFKPGMTAASHTHSGAEAWYTLSGETCLETPEGRRVGRPGGDPVIIAEGLPMHLTATGTDIRRVIALVLHDAAKPWATPAPEWKPKGLCVG